MPFISGRWARLERDGFGYRFVALSRTNPTFVNGKPVSEARLQPGDVLFIGSPDEPALTIAYVDSDDAGLTRIEHLPHVESPLAPPADVRVQGGEPILIGRSSSSSIVLDDLRVSRHHARITTVDEAAYIEDLNSTNGVFVNSTNGVFVNGSRVMRQLLQADDLIRIGPYRLVYDGTTVRTIDDRRRVRLDATDLTRSIGDKVILEGVSITVLPGQRFAIAGTSGAGKSTLMDALNGVHPPDEGSVRINGTELYASFDSVQPLFGYTPQENIVHTELPVRRALMYSARLRLPSDVSRDEMGARVDHVLQQLGLLHVRDLEIRKLSGGQLKRASIASELLANPGLLFLDEPTTGLDPGLTLRLMELVNALAKAGHTVIIVTHDTASLAQCDQMIFLAAGGKTAFIGSPAEARRYFEVRDLASIYTRVENEETSEWWAQRWSETAAARAQSPRPSASDDAATRDLPRIASDVRQRKSFARQYAVLVQRRIEILFRDRRNLALLLLQAPAIGILLALVFGTSAFDEVGAIAAGAADRDSIANHVPKGALASALPLILAASATWFGTLNAAREIVKELPVFARERRAGLRTLPYLTSKITVLAALAAVQIAMLLGIVLIKVEVPMRGQLTYATFEMYITLLLTAIAAEALGLLVSAVSSNADRAQSFVPILLIPQIIFVGGPLASHFSYLISSITITRWSIEAMKITLQVPYRGTGGFTAGDILLRWGVLAAELAVFFTAAALVVRNKREGSG